MQPEVLYQHLCITQSLHRQTSILQQNSLVNNMRSGSHVKTGPKLTYGSICPILNLLQLPKCRRGKETLMGRKPPSDDSKLIGPS